MSDDTIEHGADKIILLVAWEAFAINPSFWVDGSNLGMEMVLLLLQFGGREPCERVALYWNQHGRDDIAMKVKSIIRGEEKP